MQILSGLYTIRILHVLILFICIPFVYSDQDNLQDKTNSVNECSSSTATSQFKSTTQLIEILEGEYPEESKVSAVYKLGEMQNEDAIPILINNFHIGSKPVILKGQEPFKKALPVWDVLTNIGEPAVPYLLDELRKPNNSIKQWQLLFTLSSIIGNQDASTKIRVLSEDTAISESTRISLKNWADDLESPYSVKTKK